jgi:hypothetical protein
MHSVASFLSRWSPISAGKTLSATFDAYQSGDFTRAFTGFRDLATTSFARSRASKICPAT